MNKVIICKNVFRNEDKNIIKKEFEKILIEMINQIEKNNENFQINNLQSYLIDV